MKGFIKKIDQINFEILSPDDIRKMSCVHVETPDTYDSDGYPIENGLMDSRMGVLDSNLKCPTCGDMGGDCQGHFGSIELAKPIIHVGFADMIHKLLRSTCNHCGRVLLPDEVLEEYKKKLNEVINNKGNLDDILKKIYNETKKVEMPSFKQNDIVEKIMGEIFPEENDVYDIVDRQNILLNILNQLYMEAYIVPDEEYNYKYFLSMNLCPHCRKNKSLEDIYARYTIIKTNNSNDINFIKENILSEIKNNYDKQIKKINKKINELNSYDEVDTGAIEKLKNQKANIVEEYDKKFDSEFKAYIQDYIKFYIQKLIQEPIFFDKPVTFHQGNYKLTASEIRKRLKMIPDEDIKVLGINPDVVRPEWLVLTVLPVPPVTVRASETLPTGERKESDLTHKLIDVLRLNQRLLENIEAGAPQLIVEDLWDLLQYHVTTYFDNEAIGVPPSKHRSGRKLETLIQMLKGKNGRFRSNLSGKYVNFSGRSVISPDPNIGINEIGVPEFIAKELTVPVYVNDLNINKIRKYIENGSNVYPGANFIITTSEIRRKINNETKDYILENLKPGDIVERHLTNGDFVLLNRQPSLHRMSILAHEVKVHPNNTLNLHPCVTPPYNADFDGDEMNIHVLQTDESRAEAKSLMLVENNLMSPRYGGPIIGTISDIVSGTFLLTKNNTEFSEEEALQILRKSNVKFPPFKNGYWVLKYDNDYAEESFIYKKKGEKWKGKELFSLLLPNDLNLQFNSKINEISYRFNDESYVTIEEGILKNGIIDENACGAFSGHLLDKLAKEYGFNKARIFLEKISLMSIAVFMKFGITTSLHDYEIPSNAEKKLNKHLNESEKKVNLLICAYIEGFLDVLPRRSLEETLEIRIMQVLSEARDYAGEICELYFDNNNQNFPFSTFGSNTATMTYAGYYSSKLNFTQISACVGQQAVRGGRIHRGYIERTLPHFKRNDLSAKAKGFIKSSFKQGLEPIEFFFHAMGGREGLVNVAVRTAQSGYMQRRLIHALLELSSDKNGLVKDNHGNVVQLLYGEDGVDPAKSDFGNPADLDRLIDEIKIKNNADESKIFNLKKNFEQLLKHKEEYERLSKKLNRGVNYLPNQEDDDEVLKILNYVDNLKYNKDNQENPPSLLVENDFIEILDNYENQKQKQFKTSDFILKFQDKVKIDVFKFVRSVVKDPLDSFSVRCIFGVNSWAEIPSISIINNDIYESFQEGLHINYTFDTKNSKVYLSINPRSKNNDMFTNLKKSLIEKLKNITISNEFIVGNNDFDKYTVILKEYKKEEIDSSILEKDLKELLSIYSSLYEVYEKITKDEELDKINAFDVKLDFNVDRLNSILNNPKDDSINIINLKFNPYKYFNYGHFSNDYNEVELLFSDENLNKLKNFNFKYSTYNDILKTILTSFTNSLDNFLNENNLKESFLSLSITEKILIFAKSFVNVKYKSIQNELGYLSFNQIFIDDRLNESQTITTIIHELSHYILSEILKLFIMTILDSKKNPLIEAYVCLTLDDDLWYLLDEFCAHTVEGRFALYGYQDYGSFEYKFNEVSPKYSDEDIDNCLDVANTFAQDIKGFMEHFILNSFREEIKEKFNESNALPSSNGLNYERNTTLNPEGFMEALRVILYKGALSCTDRKNELKLYASKFEKNLKTIMLDDKYEQ